ncbi:ATP-dependent sacrificial sulfur transferase LarE [Fundidesulfovibrio terrae]|uniref:ATP-dependent sacrificial sulfur transferase LarE n=1 Tax=Fundidesulfovibrio terrae TaxID=2922866 RepID=UPI001FAF4B8C|nr:ATP-dependent sacrificial sulfur transferase LarE [Fundidesulfovibrio terrae]
MTPSVHTTEKKYRDLLGELRSMKKALVAFSGGVDSTFLLHAARQALDENVLAVSIATPYIPVPEIEDARSVAQAMNVRHLVVEVPFPEPLRANPPDRCYLCKLSLFTLLQDVAAREKIAHVLDGTNLDDLDDYRPGLRALGELGVKSPLLTSGLTKQDIRDLSKAHGLATWDKPAAACLLSRIPHGTRIEETELRRIDQAERFLKDLGFAAVRLRSHGDLARIEVPREWVGEVIEADRRHGIDARLKELGYRHVTVDLAGYRLGSLNVNAA